jgi:hypothetical protein
VDHFPHKRFSRNVQTEYIAQLLVICGYEPSLQARVLQLVVTKCLEMDVEIVIEDSGEVHIEEDEDADVGGDDMGGGDGMGGDMFQIDDNTHKPTHTPMQTPIHKVNAIRRPGAPGASLTGASRIITIKTAPINPINPITATATATATARIPAEVAEMADKLDTMLCLLSTFCAEQIQASAENSERILAQLLAIFEASILTIHKSKFVQFCVFYSASLDARFAQAVGEKLMGIVLDERSSASARQVCITIIDTMYHNYTAYTL